MQSMEGHSKEYHAEFRELLWSLIGPGGATIVTLWVINTWPPENPIWRYLAYYVLIPAAWIAALLYWSPVRGCLAKQWSKSSPIRKVGSLLSVTCIIIVLCFVVFWFRPVAGLRGTSIQRADISHPRLDVTVLGPNRSPTIDVHIDNKGAMPADVQSLSGIYVSTEHDSVSLEAMLFQEMLDDSKHATVVSYEVPAGSQRFFHHVGEPLSVEEERQIRSNRASVYFLGKLNYRDAVGWQAYEYCLYRNNEAHTLSCMTHNGPALP